MTHEEFLAQLKTSRVEPKAPPDEVPQDEPGIGAKLAGFVEGLPGGAGLTRGAGGAGAAIGTLAGGGSLDEAGNAFHAGYEETGKDIEKFTKAHPVIATTEQLPGAIWGGGAATKGAAKLLGSGIAKEILATGGVEGLSAFANAKARGATDKEAVEQAGLSATLSGGLLGAAKSIPSAARSLAGVSEEASNLASEMKAYPELAKEALGIGQKLTPERAGKVATKAGYQAMKGRPIRAVLTMASELTDAPKKAYLVGLNLAESPKLAPWKPMIEESLKRGPKALIGTMYMIQHEDPRTADVMQQVLDEYNKEGP